MREFLTAPTERPPVASLGSKSSLPEKLGVDILFECPRGMVGIQRKTIPDLIASVQDGRLGRELAQIESASFVASILALEGIPRWNADGELSSAHSRWTLHQHWGVLRSVQQQGVIVLETRTPLETCSLAHYLYDKYQVEKQRMSSLLARQAPPKTGWGQWDDRATAIHILTGFPGMGLELAERIIDKFGGLPIAWTIGKTELMSVEGLGKRRTDMLWRALHTPEGNEWWLPWLAALIDGEGMITFSSIKGQKGIYEVVTIGNTNRALIERIRELTNLGRIYTSASNRHQPFHTWTARAAEGSLIVHAVRKFLINKAPQADLVLEYRRDVYDSSPLRLTEEGITARQDLLRRMRHFNALSSGRYPENIIPELIGNDDPTIANGGIV